MKFYNNYNEFVHEVCFMVGKYCEINTRYRYPDSIEESMDVIDKAMEELINVNNGIAIKEV